MRPPLAATGGQVLAGILVAIVAFVLVIIVCVAVLALLQLILPRTDAEAERVHRDELLRAGLAKGEIGGATGEDAPPDGTHAGAVAPGDEEVDSAG